MKNIKKFLLVLGILFTSILLVSCGGNSNESNSKTEFVILNETSGELFVDEFTNSKEVSSLKAWYVGFNGGLKDLELKGPADTVRYYDNNKNLVGIEGATIKEYEFLVSDPDLKNKTLIYRQYLKQTNNDNVIDVLIDYVEYDNDSKIVGTGSSIKDSYIYEGKYINVYLVYAKGETKKLENVTFEGFPLNDDLIKDGKYRNYETFDIKVVSDYKNVRDITFKVRLAATQTPISRKTASFWNWIFLQIPIAYLMAFIGSITGGSFALGILLTTLIVRTLAWPIYSKTNDLSMKMNLAQPEIDRLNRKYVTRKDPESQQKMQMEMMAIYKKHKINMFGCLYPFLQMPIFFAMYEVVRRITIPGGQFYNDVHHTGFIFTDLNTTNTFVKIIFTILVGATMYLLQIISSKKPSYIKSAPQKAETANQQAKTMKMVSTFMIIMMVVTAYATKGLALSFYWIIGNLYAIGQTWFNHRLNEKKYKKLQKEKLYGSSKNIIDAEFEKKGEK